MLLEGVVFGKFLGHEGRILINELDQSIYKRDPREPLHHFLYVRTQHKRWLVVMTG